MTQTVPDLSDLVTPGHVDFGVAVRSKKALFGALGRLAAATLPLDAEEVAAGLMARERLGSTGFGGGVAIPHARIAGVDRIHLFLVRLAQPLEFAAVDDAPVDIVAAMLSPPNAGADHLKALARVSRRLRDASFVEKLRGAGSRDALWALLTEDQSRDAA